MCIYRYSNFEEINDDILIELHNYFQILERLLNFLNFPIFIFIHIFILYAKHLQLHIIIILRFSEFILNQLKDDKDSKLKLLAKFFMNYYIKNFLACIFWQMYLRNFKKLFEVNILNKQDTVKKKSTVKSSFLNYQIKLIIFKIAVISSFFFVGCWFIIRSNV